MGKKARLVVVILALLLATHLLFGPSRQKTANLVSDEVSTRLFMPVSRFFSSLKSSVQGAADHYVFLTGVAQENERLQSVIQTLSIENQNLKQALGLKNDHQSAKARYAFLKKNLLPLKILGFDPFFQSKTIWVDAGKDKGVVPNQVVVTSQGLVGKVSRVYGSSSQVLLLIDNFFRVDAMNERTKMRCLVRGMHGDALQAKRQPFLSQIEFFETGQEMREGDTLVTSGLGGVFPEGIPIGTISEIETNDAELFQKSVVLPQVDFAHFNRLYLLQ